MKKIITLSMFALSLCGFCLADGLPISDVIKEARDNAIISKTVNKEVKDETTTTDKSDVSKQDIKDNVTDTLDDLKKVN